MKFSECICDVEIHGKYVLHHKTFAELLRTEFEILLEPLCIAGQLIDADGALGADYEFEWRSWNKRRMATTFKPMNVTYVRPINEQT